MWYRFNNNFFKYQINYIYNQGLKYLQKRNLTIEIDIQKLTECVCEIILCVCTVGFCQPLD